jgi:uncharacterized protein (DUF1501 family)
MMVSAAATVPGFVTQSGSALAQQGEALGAVGARPGVPEDRVLVVVQLSGGNDGLNTVVPVGHDAYYRARPRLAVAAEDAVQVGGPGSAGGGLALHPELAPLSELMQTGRAAAVVGVGYPNPNRSHFESMDIWHAGDPLVQRQRGTGWIGRALDRADVADAGAMACVAIGSEAPPATIGAASQPTTFDDPGSFRWLPGVADRGLAGEHTSLLDAAAQARVDHRASPESADSALAFVQRATCDAQAASDQIRRAVGAQLPGRNRFARNGLSQQLEQVAAMIAAGLPTRVYYVALGGFDTHANQRQTHDRLMGQFAQAMADFQGRLDAAGHAERVVTVAFSEFGRRVAQNASGGTDHGAAGPMFLFGPQLRHGGIVGQHPSLDPDALDNGDLAHTLDFRQVYAELLDGWMGVPSGDVLGQRFRATGLLAI